ncbi:hypothetical protein, partial [Enterobacter hormaechei]|uniref:hypothetical protein n=1 Tax=Enterobacter hormaechei TaxID=158836 RepID=UPI00195405BE
FGLLQVGASGDTPGGAARVIGLHGLEVGVLLAVWQPVVRIVLHVDQGLRAIARRSRTWEVLEVRTRVVEVVI